MDLAAALALAPRVCYNPLIRRLSARHIHFHPQEPS